MAFGVTPVEGQQQVDDEFPNFIQFQEDGVDLGDADADVVNFAAGLTATRGEGEQANVITVTALFPLQALGVPFEDPLPTALNFGSGITATQDVDGVVTITTEAPPELAWRTITTDDSVLSTDVGNGIIVDSTIDVSLTIPADVIANGRCVLVLQRDAGAALLVPDSGVSLVFRSSAFDNATAGAGATVSLIGLPDGGVLLCGDMLSL